MKIFKIISVSILALGLIILLFVNSCSKDDDNPGPKKGDYTESPSDRTNSSVEDTLPNIIREQYHLSMGSKIRVYTHEGYDYNRSSGGWKYYCTPQNGLRTIRGDGTSHDDGKDIAYFDLEFYEVECDILVVYVKIKK